VATRGAGDAICGAVCPPVAIAVGAEPRAGVADGVAPVTAAAAGTFVAGCDTAARWGVQRSSPPAAGAPGEPPGSWAAATMADSVRANEYPTPDEIFMTGSFRRAAAGRRSPQWFCNRKGYRHRHARNFR